MFSLETKKSSEIEVCWEGFTWLRAQGFTTLHYKKHLDTIDTSYRFGLRTKTEMLLIRTERERTLGNEMFI